MFVFMVCVYVCKNEAMWAMYVSAAFIYVSDIMYVRMYVVMYVRMYARL